MYDIIIVGAGGFGREVYQWSLDTFDKNIYRLKGFLALNKNELDGFDIPLKIIGHEDNYDIKESDRFILAIGNIDIKKKVAKNLKKKGAYFLELIHPTALVFPNSKIGEGVVVCPYSIISDSVVVGNFSMLNVYTYCGHDSRIGEYCILSPYSTLNGSAVLGDGVFMATHSVVAPLKFVGSGATIGANSLVLHNVPDNAKILGTSHGSKINDI